MARPLWKGSISFGLVNIPVELFVGARDHTPRFRLLHRADLSPISLERVCQTDGKAVAWDDLVKGHEVEKGRFIARTEDDFKTAAIERSLTSSSPVSQANGIRTRITTATCRADEGHQGESGREEDAGGAGEGDAADERGRPGGAAEAEPRGREARA